MLKIIRNFIFFNLFFKLNECYITGYEASVATPQWLRRFRASLQYKCDIMKQLKIESLMQKYLKYPFSPHPIPFYQVETRKIIEINS